MSIMGYKEHNLNWLNVYNVSFLTEPPVITFLTLREDTQIIWTQFEAHSHKRTQWEINSFSLFTEENQYFCLKALNLRNVQYTHRPLPMPAIPLS